LTIIDRDYYHSSVPENRMHKRRYCPEFALRIMQYELQNVRSCRGDHSRPRGIQGGKMTMAISFWKTHSGQLADDPEVKTAKGLRSKAAMNRKLALSCGKWIGSLAVLLFCAALSLKAQIRSGTITGIVTDQKGAVVVDAQVTVTNGATHVSYTTKTTQAGLYSVPYLENGTYDVSVFKAGFQTETVNGVSVTASQIARADVALRIGTATATIEVQASTEQLQTESSTVSGGVSTVEVENIPNVTQNPLYYLTLQNDVQPREETYTSQTITSAGAGVAGRAELSSIGINGGRAFENDIQLDGLPDTGDGFNEMTVVPNEEGIQETRVVNSNFTADYGHGQGVILFTTRSGTNQYHGEVNFLFRNEDLDANFWGNKVQGIPRPQFQRSNAGAALGGPIKRNKIFFFSSYHYMTQNQGQTYIESVPTALERVGNFTQTMQEGANGQPAPAQLFNPYQVTQIGTNLYQRAPITPAIITPSLLPEGPAANTAALLMYNYYPTPNHQASDVYNDNNYESNVVNTLRFQNSNNRVDFKQGRHSIYGSGGIYWDNVDQPFALQPDTPVSGDNNNPSTSFNNAPSTTSDRNGYAQLGDTIVLSPSLFVDVRYGVTRTHAIDFGGLPSGFNQYDAFGIAAATQALFAKPGSAPPIYPNSGGGSGGGSNWENLSGGGFANKEERQIGHAVNASVTKIHGSWTFKAGSEFRVILANYTDFEEGSASMNFCCSGDPGGNYNFEYVTAGGGTTPQDNNPLVDGINGAKMLLGQGVWFVRPGANLKPAYAAKYFAVYSQNDWRVRPGLTLNLGLRYEIQPGLTERYNRLAGYDFTQKNPFGTWGVLSFPGTNGYSRNMWDTEYNDIQPRLGAAYQITKTLVARGGFAIAYMPSNTGYFSSPNDYGEASFVPGNEALPFGASPNGLPTTEFTDAAPLVASVGANTSAPQNYGINEAYFDRHLKNQVVNQANFFLEKSFGSSNQWLIAVGWSDAVSRHLTTRNEAFEDLQNVDPALLSLWKSQYLASNGTTDPAYELVPNPYQPAGGSLLPFQNDLANATIQQFIPNLPYPLLYGGGQGLNGSTGFGNYNAGQVHFSHHMSAGLDLTVNYTWSKELDYVTTGIEDGQDVNAGGTISSTPDLLNPHNNKNYGLADLPNRFNTIVVYESQFGSKGKFALSSPVGRAIAGDWILGTTVEAQDGYPVVLSMSNDNAITGRMDRNPAWPLVLPKSYQHMYNGSTLVTLPCGTTITPPAYNLLKYDLCAYQGETLDAPNGSIIPNDYWIGDAAQTNGDIRLPRRTNVDFQVSRTFPIRERFHLEFAAEISNLFNHPEFSASWSGNLGSMNLTNNPSAGFIPGNGSNGGFGALSTANNSESGVSSTYDPRQVVLQGFVRF
jgi:trimeric autotransporter adhesin